MRYDFECDCGATVSVEARPFHPPEAPSHCGRIMLRIYGCEIDTSACKDADDIPVQNRVNQKHDISSAQGAKTEAMYAADIAAKRRANRSGRPGAFTMTHSIPPELYHGKIKQTRDRNYWADKKNLAKHGSCKVV